MIGVQAEKQTRVLGASMLALCSLHALLNTPSKAEAEVLGACASVLADCDALLLYDNAFLKHCLGRIIQCPYQLFDGQSGEVL